MNSFFENAAIAVAALLLAVIILTVGADFANAISSNVGSLLATGSIQKEGGK